MERTGTGRNSWWLYVAMIAAAAAAFFLIRWQGEGLNAPPPGDGTIYSGVAKAHPRAYTGDTLLALAVMLIASRVASLLGKRIGQPPVIGEIVVGILLGPSLLGRISPEAMQYIFPKEIVPNLAMISQVGVILYMFVVGLELDLDLLRDRGRTAVLISHASIVTPFLLGSGLALLLYPRVSSSDVPFVVFALFMGVSMSVTAFPVLARILTDRNMQKTPLGAMALTCAAVDDVTAWCLLALVVGIAQSHMASVIHTLVLLVVYLAAMLLVVRPFLRRLVQRYGMERPLNQGALAMVCIGLILSALATNKIGVHAIFGAFLMGAILPHDAELARDLRCRLEELIVVLFLPAFFVVTGLRTEIGLVSGASQWALCGLIIVIDSLGKFGGTLVAARAGGVSWQNASALGVLMNTRGLMELVVLNIGFDMAVLSHELFTMLVVMAVVTTMATSPLLDLVMRGKEKKVPIGATA